MPLSHWNAHSKQNLTPSSMNKPTGKLTPAKAPSKKPSGTGRLAVVLQGLNPQSQAEQNPQFNAGSRKSGQGYGSTPPGAPSPSSGSRPNLRSGLSRV